MLINMFLADIKNRCTFIMDELMLTIGLLISNRDSLLLLLFLHSEVKKHPFKLFRFGLIFFEY